MFVRFLGFTLDGTKEITTNDLLSKLSEGKSNKTSKYDSSRLICINSEDNKEYHLGLIVTIKDQKKFCELEQQSQSLKVKVKKLSTKSKLMDFNFFVVNKKSGVGLYQHYHQSCSVGKGMYLLQREYHDLRVSLKDQHVLNLVKSGKSENKAKTEANKKFKGNLKHEILIRKEKLQEILEEMSTIKNFEIKVAFLSPQEKEFQPLTGLVDTQRIKFNFYNSKSMISKIATGITKVIKNNNIDDGRILGTDEYGLERIIRITDNPDNFGEYDYDEVAQKIDNLDINDIGNSWVIEQLLIRCREFKHIFEAKRS